MDRYVADFHIHSKYSYDSLMRPKKILTLAKRNGLDMVAVTDHNTIRGGMECRRYEVSSGVRVVVGAEIKSDVGDIIGIGLNEEIHSSHWADVIEEVHDQGGIVVLPHPYRGHNRIDELAKHVDIIEVWNARSNRDQNAAAKTLATSLKKKMVMGSDAHLYREVGHVKAVYNINSWALEREIHTEYSGLTDICWSQVIGHLRRGELLSLIKEGTQWAAKKVL